MSTTLIESTARSLVQLPNGCKSLSNLTDPFTFSSSLIDHPLFEEGRIKQLLRTLPRDVIEVRAVQTTANDDGMYQRGPLLVDADPVDVFERLEAQPAWMLLHHSWEHDGDYARLLKEYADALATQCPELEEGISDLGCWMFLSSGRSVVHFHADPDQSFLNQIRGSKTVFVYPRAVVPDSQVEDLVVTYDQKSVTYRPEFEGAMFPPVHLEPGDATFLPLYAPHRVINDDGVCVSWNVGFHTRRSRFLRDVLFVNHEMRRWGMNPSPAGVHPLRDQVKAPLNLAVRARAKLARMIGRG